MGLARYVNPRDATSKKIGGKLNGKGKHHCRKPSYVRYKSTNKALANKKRKLQRHLREQPHDAVAESALVKIG